MDQKIVKSHKVGRITERGGLYSCKVTITYQDNKKDESTFWDKTKEAVKEKADQYLKNAGITLI